MKEILSQLFQYLERAKTTFKLRRQLIQVKLFVSHLLFLEKRNNQWLLSFYVRFIIILLGSVTASKSSGISIVRTERRRFLPVPFAAVRTVRQALDIGACQRLASVLVTVRSISYRCRLWVYEQALFWRVGPFDRVAALVGRARLKLSTIVLAEALCIKPLTGQF